MSKVYPMRLDKKLADLVQKKVKDAGLNFNKLAKLALKKYLLHIETKVCPVCNGTGYTEKPNNSDPVKLNNKDLIYNDIVDSYNNFKLLVKNIKYLIDADDDLSDNLQFCEYKLLNAIKLLQENFMEELYGPIDDPNLEVNHDE